MKILILLALMLFSFDLPAGEGTKTWFCRQNGAFENVQAMVVSHLWSDSYPNHYEERQLAFEKFVQKATEGKFRPTFEAKCRDYVDPKHAKKHRDIELRTAEKWQAAILQLAWRWRPNVRE